MLPVSTWYLLAQPAAQHDGLYEYTAVRQNFRVFRGSRPDPRVGSRGIQNATDRVGLGRVKS